MTIDRNRRVLLLGLLLATVSAVLSYQVLATRLNAAPAVVEVTPPTGQPVLVAASFIAAGATITAGDLEVAYVDAEAVAERALTTSSQAAGKTALVDIPAGEQLLAGAVGEAGPDTAETAGTFAGDVPVGMRAISIEVEEAVSVGGLVQPGDRVDVIGAFDLKPVRTASLIQDVIEGEPENDAEEFPVAELLLQDVEVLAVGQALDPTSAADASAPAEAAVAGEPVARPEATSVTLLVDPAQSLRLLLAIRSEGTFRLLLRAPGDTTVTSLPPAVISDGVTDGEPYELIGANLAPAGLVITDARFQQTSVPAGGILEFEVTVRNASSQLIAAGGGGAGPGHVYRDGQTWQTIGESARPGVFGVALTSGSAAGQTYPWRWDLGQDLAPGQSVTIAGGVEVPNQAGGDRWWFGVFIQPGTVVEDGVGITQVAIEPATAVVVSGGEAELRDGPWQDAATVEAVAEGTEASVVEYRDGWFLVRAGDHEGWLPETAVINADLPDADVSAGVAETEHEEVQ